MEVQTPLYWISVQIPSIKRLSCYQSAKHGVTMCQNLYSYWLCFSFYFFILSLDYYLPPRDWKVDIDLLSDFICLHCCHTIFWTIGSTLFCLRPEDPNDRTPDFVPFSDSIQTNQFNVVMSILPENTLYLNFIIIFFNLL